jgi:hypothetical protein
MRKKPLFVPVLVTTVYDGVGDGVLNCPKALEREISPTKALMASDLNKFFIFY